MDFNPIKLLTEQIEKLITEHGSAAILAEHVSLLKTRIDTLIYQIETLEKQNADLKRKCSDYERQNPSGARLDEFVEYRGSLFKRKPEGGYHLSVYCPKCKCALGGKMFQLQCSSCHFMSVFYEGDIANAIKELPKQEIGAITTG
jgi:hypothetical protein